MNAHNVAGLIVFHHAGPYFVQSLGAVAGAAHYPLQASAGNAGVVPDWDQHWMSSV